MTLDSSLDLDRTRELFESSTDFTIGLEEEFAIVDPQTLDLQHRFEDLHAACQRDELLAESAVGELISSEIEIQHYQRLREELRWVAQRNNSWSLHVHMGIKGADRAVAVCDHLRGVLPALLAVSANSPFLDGQDTGLHSVRTEIFTRVFPRCGIHEPFGGWAAYTDFIGLLVRTNSIVEATQLWWSVRPHHSFGTVELRICDAQTRGTESFSLAGLIAVCIAQSALDYDDGALPEPQLQREIEENLWRAIRYGMDGKLIDFTRDEEVPASEALERLVEWTAPARDGLGIEVAIPDANGAQRARRGLESGSSIEDIYREAVAETRRTYVPEGVTSA